jgi:hypothetical protein
MDWQKEASDGRFIDEGIGRGAGFEHGIWAGNVEGRTCEKAEGDRRRCDGGVRSNLPKRSGGAGKEGGHRSTKIRW